MQAYRERAASTAARAAGDRSQPPTFSLIVATYGRTVELDRLFHSLAVGKFDDFECIVVDQNEDDRLKGLISIWQSEITIKHVRSARGLSRARNAGLHYATGKIITFPDDDCWYSHALLESAAEFFRENPAYSLLSVGVRDAGGAISGNRWVRDVCDLATTNLFRTSVGYGLFVRREFAGDSPQFDESLGVGAGTPFASGEDTDYVFRLMAAGLKGRFDRRLTVYHSRGDMLSGRPTPARAFGYGCGMGRVIRQREKFPLLPAFVLFDFLRAAFSLFLGRLYGAALCAAHGRGICAGYLATRRGSTCTNR